MNILRISLVVMMTTLLLSSCDKDQTVSVFDAYPQEMTVYNYHEFIDAPKEVIDRVLEKERALEKEIAEQRLKHQQNIIPPSLETILNSTTSNSSTTRGSLLARVTSYNTLTEDWDTPFADAYISVFGAGYDIDVFRNLAYPFFIFNTGSNWISGFHSPHTFSEVDYRFSYLNPLPHTYTHRQWCDMVSSEDLHKIMRHILGREPFTNLAQYLAADADSNGLINQNDIDLIQNLIVNNRQNLPPIVNNSSNICLSNQPYHFVDPQLYDYINNNLHEYSQLYSLLYDGNCRTATLSPVTGRLRAEVDVYAIKRGNVSDY